MTLGELQDQLEPLTLQYNTPVLVEHRAASAIAPVPVRDLTVRWTGDDCQLVLVVDHRD